MEDILIVLDHPVHKCAIRLHFLPDFLHSSWHWSVVYRPSSVQFIVKYFMFLNVSVNGLLSKNLFSFCSFDYIYRSVIHFCSSPFTNFCSLIDFLCAQSFYLQIMTVSLTVPSICLWLPFFLALLNCVGDWNVD